MTPDKALQFEAMGGRAAVQRVTNCFYDKIYADSWLRQFFEGIPREHIESQQVDFMQAALGGYNQYGGKTPPSGHKHINITEEVYQARQNFLKQAFKEVSADPSMVDLWLKVEDTFKKRVVKESIDDCEMRYSTEGIRDFPKPSTR
jgi:truncated hemoglobin YjbI